MERSGKSPLVFYPHTPVTVLQTIGNPQKSRHQLLSVQAGMHVPAGIADPLSLYTVPRDAVK